MASRLRRRSVVVPVVLVLVAGGGAVAYASSGGSAAGYRTAVIGTGDVEQLLTLAGTVAAVNQGKAHFRTTGTVSAVPVTVGQQVVAGQVLAVMATKDLADAVTKATAGLAKAKATLETDKTSTTTSSSTASPAAVRSTSTATGSGTQALAAAQRTASQALQAATRALSQAGTACGTTVPSGRGTRAPHLDASPSPTASASDTSSPSTSPTPAPSTAAPASTDAACAAALQAALGAQQTSATAQQAVGRLLQTSSTSRGASSSSSSSASSSSSSSSSGGGGGFSGQGSGSLTQAARVTIDTAAVSAAQSVLDGAQADLAAVTLRSPIAGTVATIPWTAGGSASPSDAAVIVGGGAVDVTVDVPSTSIRSIKVGQRATVQADGAAEPVAGAVSAIGLLPVTSTGTTSSTTSYPVTVRVATGAGLVDGSQASVSIVLATVKGVVRVPNSALRNGAVTVLVKGKASTLRVVTGASGALFTEVTSGLTAGQTVVLADLSEALPTSSTSASVRGGFGGAGFGGAGGFGGTGFAGGGFTRRG